MTLALRGHEVSLREAAEQTYSGAASRVAGAMLAPYCESESAHPVVRELGLRGLELWQQFEPALLVRGTLVVAAQRDESELVRFARMTHGHQHLDQTGIGHLEPILADRFRHGLYFTDEAHVPPRAAMKSLIGALLNLGVDVRFSAPIAEPIWLAAPAGGIVIDCRGLAARSDRTPLRGVRGEMAVVQESTLNLSRPVRFLHPRFPIYIVPWGNDVYMIGATMIESDSPAGVTVRSALELMSAACAVHPAFLDARITEYSVGVRPAFDDNVPKIGACGKCISVNGAYRHGFLLAPVLAEMVADHLEHGQAVPLELRN